MDRRVVVPLAFGAVAAVLVLAAIGAFGPLTEAPGYQPTDDGTGTATDDVMTTGNDRGGTTGTRTATAAPTSSAYERATVRFVDENGTELGVVRVAVAETRAQKYTGLSKTDSLPKNRGMLFPYDSERDLAYVMRNMSFGIDIIYVAANGTVTRIHHAPEPPEGEDGEDYRYPGRGQYVVEVNYNWTVRHGVEVGDKVRIEGYEG